MISASRARRLGRALAPGGRPRSRRFFELFDASGLTHFDALRAVEIAFAFLAFVGIDLEQLALVRDRLVGTLALAGAAPRALIGDDLHGHYFSSFFSCGVPGANPAHARFQRSVQDTH